MTDSISCIKERFLKTDINDIPNFIEELKNDNRKGVLNIISQAEKKYNAHLKEVERILDLSHYEFLYRKKGYQHQGDH